MNLGTYSTISVPVEVKRVLEQVKGEEEWGKFLLNLYVEAKRLRSQRAFEQLASTLAKEDFKAILESSSELRERFALR